MNALAVNDLFAVLALADVSSTLRHFILDEVLTSSLFCRFLRENQYALHHNAGFEKLLPVKHVAWLSRAFETLRERHGRCFYEKTFGLLGPLLSLMPFTAFQNTPPLPKDFFIPSRDRKGRLVDCYTFESIQWDYFCRLTRSWIHQPRYLLDGRDTLKAFYHSHASSSQRYLREEFLFCKRYIDDFNTCYGLANLIPECSTAANDPTELLKGVVKIREAFESEGLSLLLEKRCLQGALEVHLAPFSLELRTMSEEMFKALFELPGWLEMWSESELGWWYALGLWQYGPACVESYIEQTFKDKRHSLVWLFLGAHQWFHMQKHLARKTLIMSSLWPLLPWCDIRGMRTRISCQSRCIVIP